VSLQEGSFAVCSFMF